MPTRGAGWLIAAAVVWAMGLGGAAGCGSAREVPSRWAGPPPGAALAPVTGPASGSGPALVFPADPSVVVADGSVAEFARGDAALAAGGGAERPADFWPERPAPSLERRTTLFLGRSNETFVFFRERRRHTDPWRVHR